MSQPNVSPLRKLGNPPMKPPKRSPPGPGARTLHFWRIAGALAAALMLTACASTVADLADPASPSAAQRAAYPAVHDLPPARAARALSDDEQIKLQKELTEAGQSQPARVEEIEREAKPVEAPPRPARPASRQAAGTRPNP